MIFTGYFALTKKYEEAGLQPVSIAGRAPEFFKGPQYKSMAPNYDMFMDWKKGKINDMQYTEIFKKKLDSLDKEAVKRFLTSFGNKRVILLCYEKPGDFCHRHIVADWIEDNLGIRVDEYEYDKIMNMELVVRDLMTYWLPKSEISSRIGESVCEKLIDDLKQNPPEGMVLLSDTRENDIHYTLEDGKSLLADYGVNEEEPENTSPDSFLGKVW